MTGLRAPRSLRRRLVLGVTVLATLAVLAAELIGFVVLRSWLLDGVDQRLADFRPMPASAFLDMRRPGKPEPGALPSDFRVYFYDARGNRLPQALGSDDRPGPRLPDSIDRLLPTEGSPASVAADAGDGNWRVLRRAGPRDLTVVVALPLDTVDGATSKILWLNGLLLIITVVALWVLGREVVRLSLLPLTRMERAAEAITAGQLDLRLPDTDPRTEIGRLGAVLNTMLDRLQQALQEREASEGRLRRFVADAGHELRTPLTAIQGFAQLALRSDRRTARERQEADRHIAQNAERMSLLVDDLQLLARLDRHPDYQQENVDLLSLAADAVSSAALQRPGHPVSLSPLPDRPADAGEGEGELDVVEVVGDPHRLRQIVENLVSNAHTHTPPGTRIHVRVGAGRAGARTGGTNAPGRVSMAPPFPAGTRVAVIEVEDDGPGLTAADAERVFERFYRADPARTRARGGSGLGLAIATAIAEGHGGRLELDPGQGRGVTFRLVLPLPAPS
ncbi:sensor histidine kinase [Streptomyces radiopugnans]|uniref:histidine kinase n=1 Tax=Streptomyces radiopugnans TaxID=403935 RepID=A0A1H9GN02_9ACTN|nr:ATP-binding protein [Streptomyces radiopugnans]SEQ51409.1 two-component system, OmpR family, sensor kinase [Streptomyces radiopugnans]